MNIHRHPNRIFIAKLGHNCYIVELLTVISDNADRLIWIENPTKILHFVMKSVIDDPEYHLNLLIYLFLLRSYSIVVALL